MPYLRWKNIPSDGFEHAELLWADSRMRLEGLTAAPPAPGSPADGMIYKLQCRVSGELESFQVRKLGHEPPLVGTYQGEGQWADATGAVMPSLQPATFLDLSFSALTPYFPIRALRMSGLSTLDITAARLALPSLTLIPSRQRYTVLAPNRYRVERLDDGFSAEIETDEQGFVRLYEGLYQRV